MPTFGEALAPGWTRLDNEPSTVRRARGHGELAGTGSVGAARFGVPTDCQGPPARRPGTRTRLQASEAAVASDVIEFQLARQRIGLTSPATIRVVIAAYFATGDSIPAVLYFPTLFIGIALILGWS